VTDFETFIITVYDLVDTAVRQYLPAQPRRRGRRPALTRSEVLTLALLAQLGRFSSERDFCRFARQRLRPFFPRLPHRSQLHRAFRRAEPTLAALSHHWAELLDAGTAAYECLDGTGVSLRSNGRRTAALPAFMARGRATRLGWFVGCRLLVATTPTGVITGWAVSPGNRHDSALATALLAERAPDAPATPPTPEPAADDIVTRTGASHPPRYLADAAFAGAKLSQRWATYAADVAAPPQPKTRAQWTPTQRQEHASARQIVETVIERVLRGLRLERDRPRTQAGCVSRLSAKMALHNACILWNRHTGHPDLAFASVIGW
jgi:DDE family transposase